MSKIRNAFRMLFILNNGQLIKTKDIAEKLGVEIRQVRRYKEILDEIFEIESISGPNGGYRLVDTYFPFKELLDKEEIMILKVLINNIENSKEDSDKINKIIDKINYSILNSNNDYVGEIIAYSKGNLDVEKFKELEFKIFEAIIGSKKIIIDYIDNKNNETTRAVYPYKHFIYRGEPYLVAYCLEKEAIRFFKFIRIKNCIVTSFDFEKTINIDEEINRFKRERIGIFYGEEYDLELEISPPMANSIKERIWVDNQEIIELEEGKILFKGKMGGGHSVISWILTMKEFVKINKPQKLKEDVINVLEKMLENHRKE